MNFALVNLGIGVGGIVGGLYVDVNEPDTFTAIFLLDAASALVPMALLLGPLRRVHGRADKPEGDASGTYLQILRQPAVRWLTALTFMAVFVGYGQFEAGFPGFGRQVAEVSTRTIGLAFAVNTAVIVLLQFLVLSRITGRRRTRVMVVMGLVWASSWLLLGATGSRSRLGRGGGRHAVLHGRLRVRRDPDAADHPARSATTWPPTTPVAATTRSTPPRSRAARSSARSPPASCSTTAAPTSTSAPWSSAASRSAAMALALERRIPAAANGVEEIAPAVGLAGSDTPQPRRHLTGGSGPGFGAGIPLDKELVSTLN